MTLWKKLGQLLVAGIVTAAVTIMFAIGAAQILPDPDEPRFRESKQNQELIIAEAVETRELLCDILVNANTPEVREAVRTHCPRATRS